ncbi:deoxyguanosinetriphosphate triphosphohydrolase [Longivirga aurantiaca]|uniref:Deoxyguanosinetriphosphate triphosphohydrolase n=1 Tax=Longivirga aurantiaca TaxID=1837743 RepID=A0ABW1T3Y9_9ACTN
MTHPDDDRLSEGYASHDEARWVVEPPKRAGRTAFARDRARVLHSAALRRLAAKTQVLAAGESDFLRTRLTHSLECAQVGRELGLALGCDPDLVEVACLSHDLGHPPFGHNGEDALAEAASAVGGFEGNAQSLRILTRLEAKTFGSEGGPRPGLPVGLNLTRAALDAATKYPWQREEGRRKFGVYDDDLDVFTWLRHGAPDGRTCFEAQVMDWADDVAYCVHDVEDAVVAGHLDIRAIGGSVDRAGLLAVAAAYAPDSDVAELGAALDRLTALSFWPSAYDGSLRDLATLKNLTSQLIGRFASAAERATRAQWGDGHLTRYAATLEVPREQRLEVAVLKAVANLWVMQREGAEDVYSRQREVIHELVAAIRLRAPEVLDPVFRAAWDAAGDDAARLRVVVDQVASLTDRSVLAWYADLCS